MKELNIDKVAKIFILLGFSAFYLKLIVTGEITLYVHPRIIPFVIFGLVTMILIALCIITNSFNNKKKFSLNKYIAFIFPLMMIIFFQLKYPEPYITNQGITANSPYNNFYNKKTESNSKYMSNMDSTNSNSKSNNPSNIHNNSEYYNDAQMDLYAGKTESNGNGIITNNALNISDGVIKINSKNFVLSLDEIIGNCSKYDGMKIEITGFIYKDPNLGLEENQFILGRYMMVCCAADMQIAGLRCQYTGSNSYDKDTWVIIKGHIKSDTYNGQIDPIILVDEINKDNNPDTSYVYPY